MRLSSGSVSLMYLDSNSYYIHLRIQLQSIGNVSSQNFRVSDSGEKKSCESNVMCPLLMCLISACLGKYVRVYQHRGEVWSK